MREGVDVVFGYPGGAIMPAYDALPRYPIRHVLVRHEQGAAHMADGYARASARSESRSRPAGPGATNLVTGIANAMLDSIPMVCITGQVPSRAARHRRLPGDRHHRRHAPDHQAQLPGHARRGHRPHRPRGVLRRALGPARAGGRRHHQGRAATSVAGRSSTTRRPAPRLPAGHATAARDLTQAIRTDRRGGAAAGSGRPRRRQGRRDRPCSARWSERAHIPVACYPARPRRLPRHAPAQPRHDGHARRGLGERGDPAGRPLDRPRHALRRPRDRPRRALRAGARRRSTSSSTRPRSTRTCGSTCRSSATSARCSREIAPRVAPRDRSAWTQSDRRDARGGRGPRHPALPDDGRLYAAHVIHDLYRLTDGEALVVTDVGQHQMWEAQYYKHDHPRKLITSGGLGTMGFALPAAIGARFAGRRRGGDLGHRRRRRLPDDGVPSSPPARRRTSTCTSPSSTTASSAWSANGRSSSTSGATSPRRS